MTSFAQDRFGRMINYLRISLTDKCNLRCVYCMAEDMVFRPRHELMQDDELRTLVNVFADLGFKKFRLTGGEPTVRQNVVEICRFIANTPGVQPPEGGPGRPEGGDHGPGERPPGRPEGTNAPGQPPRGFGPPPKPLTAEQVGLVRAWIDQGAK